MGRLGAPITPGKGPRGLVSDPLAVSGPNGIFRCRISKCRVPLLQELPPWSNLSYQPSPGAHKGALRPEIAAAVRNPL
jgi:hypothetical protein